MSLIRNKQHILVSVIINDQVYKYDVYKMIDKQIKKQKDRPPDALFQSHCQRKYYMKRFYSEINL